MVTHREQQVQRRDQIVLIILQRFSNALANGLESRKVDDRVDGELRKQPFRRVGIRQVALFKVEGFRGE